MRPALKSGLLRVWRDADTLQIGIDPRRAVALTGMASAASVLSLLDGSRDRAQLIQAAAEHGIPAATVDRVLTLLAAGGALDDFPAGTLRVLGQPLRSRFAAELATASLARRDGDGGARTLVRRRAARISIHGTGRIAAAIASILSTAGVGAVSGGATSGGAALDQSAPARLVPDRTPRPDTPSRVRTRRRTASRARPVRPPVGGDLPDLALIVGHANLELPGALMSDRTPHLSAYASEAIGVVGPLVVPGRTACLSCLHHARTDRDPAWPVILAQLAGRQPVPLACDAPLAAAVAAQASFQALAFIDGASAPDAVTNGTLELVLPAWQWRRRTWRPHPACGCGSHQAR